MTAKPGAPSAQPAANFRRMLSAPYDPHLHSNQLRDVERWRQLELLNFVRTRSLSTRALLASHAVYDAATAPSLPCPLPMLRAATTIRCLANFA